MYICYICDKKFYFKASLEEHYLKEENNHVICGCGVCDVLYAKIMSGIIYTFNRLYDYFIEAAHQKDKLGKTNLYHENIEGNIDIGVNRIGLYDLEYD